MTVHDWTLLQIVFDWKMARTTLTFLGPRGHTATLVADNVSQLNVRQTNDWGRSVSVNQILGPCRAEDGVSLCLTIEMQSGDRITLVAAAFDLPCALQERSSREVAAVTD